MAGRKMLYALVTRRCNLSCPYCDVKDIEDNFNMDLFMDQLRSFDGNIILFGGEPTLYQDRLFDIYYSDPIINRKINSITTNLMVVNDRLLTLFQSIGRVGTSWNPDRFNDNEYKIWLNNINEFESKIDTKISVLITLVDSVLNLSPLEFNNIISEWNNDAIKYIKFEHYVGDEATPEYFEKCDNWLCDIYKSWNSPIIMGNKKRILHWYNDCSNIYTLYPDGTIKRGCPHKMTPRVPNECYTCDKVDMCKPCQLQSYCSFSNKFYNLIKEESEYEYK